MSTNQAGGHADAFLVKNPGQLMKKAGKAERSFYLETLPKVDGLAAFCPKCYGVHEENGVAYTIMEDLCHGFTKPSVADIKIGLSSVGEDADEEKQRKMGAKDAISTSATLGIRFTGMVVYNAQEDSFAKFGKKWGHLLKEAEFNPSLLRFFTRDDPKVTRALLESAIAQVEAVYKWFESQHSLRFFSSSLLFVYDGANPTELRVKMIDFAHVFPIRNESERDDNYLFGVKELLARLRTLHQASL
jgi:hypothetical protein